MAALVEALQELDRGRRRPLCRPRRLRAGVRGRCGHRRDGRTRRAIDDVRQRDASTAWDAIRGRETPLVAAVSGFCLGGGCELAMTCDLIVASETARLRPARDRRSGSSPARGGTQRLTRAVGKALAMDMILSRPASCAREALAAGLVARVVAREAWLDEAKRVARQIAAKGPSRTSSRRRP